MKQTRPSFPAIHNSLLSAVILCAVCAVTVRAQSGDLQRIHGFPLNLPGGQLAILGESKEGPKLLRLFGDDNRRRVLNLSEDDLVVRCNGAKCPDLATLRRHYARLQVGQPVKLTVRRASREHDVEFAKVGGGFSIPKTGGSQQLGGWQSPGESRPPKTPSLAELKDRIKALVDDFTSGDQPGVTMGVLFQGKLVASHARGLADVENRKPLTPKTLLPVDSIAKQFTACAVAMLAAEEKLTLQDHVAKYVGELSQIDESVTLQNLLTHTSGLRDYTGLMSMTGRNSDEPITSDELLELLARQEDLQFPPGAEHRYSNTNYALLPLVVARVTGVDFPSWMQESVFGPLAMTSTLFPRTPHEQIAGLAGLYLPADQGFRQTNQTHGLPGAGGMISTSVDLLKWSRELMQGGIIGTSTKEHLTRPATLKDGTTLGYGLGVGISTFRGARRWGHSGSSPASTSVLHIYPDHGLSIAVLANYGDAEVYALAERVADLFLADTNEQDNAQAMPPHGTPGAIFLTEQDFDGGGADPGVPLSVDDQHALAGRYVLEDDRQLVLESKEGRVLLKLAHGIPGVPLVHLGKRRFQFLPGRWELTLEPEAGPAERITVHLSEDSISRSGPGDIRGVRQELRRYTEDELQQFAGRYRSSELAVTYDIVYRHGELYLQHPGIGTQLMSYQMEDRFGVDGKIVSHVQFQRQDPDDAETDVVGLTAVSWAWSADARFIRVQP